MDNVFFLFVPVHVASANLSSKEDSKEERCCVLIYGLFFLGQLLQHLHSPQIDAAMELEDSEFYAFLIDRNNNTFLSKYGRGYGTNDEGSSTRVVPSHENPKKGGPLPDGHGLHARRQSTCRVRHDDEIPYIV